MLKLFRRIRRKLLAEGRLSKYLVYAIGEVLLVIVGILIALQFNNSNNEREMRQKEYVLLLELRENLKTNIDQFNSNIDWQSKRVNDIDKIIDYSKKGKSWNDTLSVAMTHFQNPEEYFINASAYESLKSIGLDLISSDMVRKSIADIYEKQYLTNEIRNNEYGQVIFLVREPFLLKHFSYDHLKGEMIPNSPSTILNNQEFTNIVSQRRRFKTIAISSNQ